MCHHVQVIGIGDVTQDFILVRKVPTELHPSLNVPGCVACIYVSAPLACLVPMETRRGCQIPLELEAVLSGPTGNRILTTLHC